MYYGGVSFCSFDVTDHRLCQYECNKYMEPREFYLSKEPDSFMRTLKNCLSESCKRTYPGQSLLYRKKKNAHICLICCAYLTLNEKSNFSRCPFCRGIPCIPPKYYLLPFFFAGFSVSCALAAGAFVMTVFLVAFSRIGFAI